MHIARLATRNAFFAILPLLVLLAGCAAGVGRLRAGQVLSDRVGFGGHVFVLPPGRWRVVYAGAEQNRIHGAFDNQKLELLAVQ